MNLNNIVDVSNWDELITDNKDYKLFRTTVIHDDKKELYYESNSRRFVCGYKNVGYVVEHCSFELLNKSEREIAKATLSSNLFNMNE